MKPNTEINKRLVELSELGMTIHKAALRVMGPSVMSRLETAEWDGIIARMEVLLIEIKDIEREGQIDAVPMFLPTLDKLCPVCIPPMFYYNQKHVAHPPNLWYNKKK